MPVATAPSALPSRPSLVVKMEDRKRPAIADTDEFAPPNKRQATNGSASKAKEEPNGECRDEAWIEDFQKDAIYRQMNEYKRQAATLEARVEDLSKRSTYHDDHIRIIDAWLLQLIQEIEVLCQGKISTKPGSKDFPYLSALDFKDSREFQKHIGEKAKTVKARLESIFDRVSSLRQGITPDIVQLESQVKTLLAEQKEAAVKLERLEVDKEDISQQLDTATLRYIKAEKRMDRMKSIQVQKMEDKALAHVPVRPTPTESGTDQSAASSAGLSELQGKYDEALAVIKKQKEQMDRIYAEIKAIQDESSGLRAKKDSATDDDYARTDLFKQIKSQAEDAIKRANHLDASNKQLRDEVQKLQSERTTFRTKQGAESSASIGELEEQLQAKEHDLTRIRSQRDEFLADVQIRKASQDQERTAFEQLKELVAAKDDRLAALESELLRLRPAEGTDISTPSSELEALPLEELRERFKKLEKDFVLIQNEMPSVEKAYKKAIGLAQKKVMDFAALEERVAMLTLEKAKADQKYFAARKDMDFRVAEIRALRHQNSKSSEIISSLKDADAQARSVLSNFEKQLSDYRQTNALLVEESRHLKLANADAVRRSESSKSQIGELTSLVKAKDSANATLREHAAGQEMECEKLRVRLSNAQKDRDSWKTKCLANSSDEEEMLRNFALCSVCRHDFKNAIIKTCGHVFCQGCIDARLSNRMRKCPACNRAFDKMDVMTAHF